MSTRGSQIEPGQEPCRCFDEDHSLSSETTQGGLHLFIRMIHTKALAIARMGDKVTPKSGSEPKLVGLPASRD